MGDLEFNSATYYRYISLDLGQLYTNLAGKMVPKAAEAFIKALWWAVPEARQATMSGSPLWKYAQIIIRKGQNISSSFEASIRSENGFDKPSIAHLESEIESQEKRSGSFYGKIGKIIVGNDVSLDDVLKTVDSHIKGILHE
jgi:CRISPR system Cascade subunit CasC